MSSRRRILTPADLAWYKQRHGLNNAELGARLGYSSQRTNECRTVDRMLEGTWTGNWEHVDILLNTNLKKLKK